MRNKKLGFMWRVSLIFVGQASLTRPGRLLAPLCISARTKKSANSPAFASAIRPLDAPARIEESG